MGFREIEFLVIDILFEIGRIWICVIYICFVFWGLCLGLDIK